MTHEHDTFEVTVAPAANPQGAFSTHAFETRRQCEDFLSDLRELVRRGITASLEVDVQRLLTNGDSQVESRTLYFRQGNRLCWDVYDPCDLAATAPKARGGDPR